MFARYNDIRARRARGEDQGFSLIELLVVVVIMGILIAIAVPVYLNYQDSARKKAVEADVRNAIPAVEQCISDNGGSTSTLAYTAATGILTCGTGHPTQSIKASGTNTLNITFPGGKYTIEGTNTDSKWKATYDSSAGGSVTGVATS